MQRMLILRGIHNLLDEPSALKYASARGYDGIVLQASGETGASSDQTIKALAAIRADPTITALYGFSGGGYNVRHIIEDLTAQERERIKLVVVLGAPAPEGFTETEWRKLYAGPWELVYRLNPPAGHMAGPQALLDELSKGKPKMVNYRSLVSGGFFANPDTSTAHWSIRSNNPGAINGAGKGGNSIPWVQAFPGFVKTVVIGGGNPIAVFETPEQGLALYWTLLKRYRDASIWNPPVSTVQGIVNRYGGGQDYSDYVKFVCGRTGFAPSKVIDLNDDAVLLPFVKAMFRYEAGSDSPLKDEQFKYGFALARGQTPSSSSSNVVIVPPSQQYDFATRVFRAMKIKNIPIAIGADVFNIVYVEGCDPDGKTNKNRPNAFDDARLLLQVLADGSAKIVFAQDATTEPGKFWTQHRMNPGGAFHIALGYQSCWVMGEYHGAPALIQARDIRGTRDDNEDMSRGGKEDVGQFGVHHHGGYGYPHDDLGRSSAGCQVGRVVVEHATFMRLLATDRRYRENKGFVFSSTVLTAAEVNSPNMAAKVGGSIAAVGPVVGGAASHKSGLGAEWTIAIVVVVLLIAAGAFFAIRASRAATEKARVGVVVPLASAPAPTTTGG